MTEMRYLNIIFTREISNIRFGRTHCPTFTLVDFTPKVSWASL